MKLSVTGSFRQRPDPIPDPQVRKGSCKWFSSQKGYGFITPEDDSGDVFVHQSVIQADGFRSLAEGEPLEYYLDLAEPSKAKAARVTGPNGTNVQGAIFQPNLPSFGYPYQPSQSGSLTTFGFIPQATLEQQSFAAQQLRGYTYPTRINLQPVAELSRDMAFPWQGAAAASFLNGYSYTGPPFSSSYGTTPGTSVTSSSVVTPSGNPTHYSTNQHFGYFPSPVQYSPEAYMNSEQRFFPQQQIHQNFADQATKHWQNKHMSGKFDQTQTLPPNMQVPHEDQSMKR